MKKQITKWFKYTSTSWGLINVNFPLGEKKRASTSWHPILHRHMLLRHVDKFILELNFCGVVREKWHITKRKMKLSITVGIWILDESRLWMKVDQLANGFDLEWHLNTGHFEFCYSNGFAPNGSHFVFTSTGMVNQSICSAVFECSVFRSLQYKVIHIPMDAIFGFTEIQGEYYSMQNTIRYATLILQKFWLKQIGKEAFTDLNISKSHQWLASFGELFLSMHQCRTILVCGK